MKCYPNCLTIALATSLSTKKISVSLRSNVFAHRWYLLFFFFSDTATTEIYTLSLHDALPIAARCNGGRPADASIARAAAIAARAPDRKSTRLNSSHVKTAYAVFCLKKNKSSRIFSDNHIRPYCLLPLRAH